MNPCACFLPASLICPAWHWAVSGDGSQGMTPKGHWQRIRRLLVMCSGKRNKQDPHDYYYYSSSFGKTAFGFERPIRPIQTASEWNIRGAGTRTGIVPVLAPSSPFQCHPPSLSCCCSPPSVAPTVARLSRCFFFFLSFFFLLKVRLNTSLISTAQGSTQTNQTTCATAHRNSTKKTNKNH